MSTAVRAIRSVRPFAHALAKRLVVGKAACIEEGPDKVRTVFDATVTHVNSKIRAQDQVELPCRGMGSVKGLANEVSHEGSTEVKHFVRETVEPGGGIAQA